LNSLSNATFEGPILSAVKDTDYEIGPITVRGNLYADILIAGLAATGVDTSGLEQLFPDSGN
jgi:hypothetical protein